MKFFIKTAALFLILSVIFSVPVLAVADDYTINDGEIIPISPSYLYESSIDYIYNVPDGVNAYLNQPEDIYYDDTENCLYIADTMNNRVLKTTLGGLYITAYTEAGGKGLWQPKGICTDSYGNVFIADTGNSRIVKLDSEGKFIKEYGKPDSPLLADIDVYSPAKIAVAENGLIYVLMGEHIMCLDNENGMRGFIGQTEVGFSLKSWFIRKFASEEQKLELERETADSYENFCMSETGIIYASSHDTDEGQIKALNSVGNNIYRKLASVSGQSEFLANIVRDIFSGNIISKSYSYGETVENEPAVFSDICVDKDGIVSVIQKQNGRIYQYDADGILLASFGSFGTEQGLFAIPNSLVVDNDGKIYVLDYSKANIQIFTPTEFIKTVHQASLKYADGDYTGAEKLCNEILKSNETYPLAHTILANIAYKEGNWKAAMEGYEYTNDRTAYSKAFTEYRYEIMMNYYIWVFLGVAVCVAALYFGFSSLNRASKSVLYDYELYKIKRPNFKQTALLGIGVMFRPFRSMEAIKGSRYRIGKKVPVFIFILLFAVRLLFVYTVSYPLMDIEIKDVNLFLELVKLILPLISWIIVVYLLSSQFDGESTFSENFVAVSFASIPYIIFNLFATAVSQFMSTDEKGFFALLVNGVWVLIIILLIISVNKLNDYTAGKTLIISFVSLITIVLLWFIILLSYMCITELIQFVSDIIKEIQLL